MASPVALTLLIVAAFLGSASGVLVLAKDAKPAPGPIEQLQTMINTMVDDKTAEGIAAAKDYDDAAAKCMGETISLKESITLHTGTIDAKSSFLQETTQEKVVKEADAASRTTSKETNAAALTAEVLRCNKEHAVYEQNKADNTKSISQITNAKAQMKARSGHLDGSSLIQAEQLYSLKDVLDHDALAEVSKIADPAYKYHSMEIKKLLTNLLDTFTTRKTSQDSAWTATSADCSATQKIVADQMKTDMDAVTSLTTDISGLKENLAIARTALQSASNDLDADSRLLTTTTASCELKARTFDKNANLRKQMLDPLIALQGQLATLGTADAAVTTEKAVVITKTDMTDRVATLDAKKQAREDAVRSFLQKRGKGSGFLQVSPAARPVVTSLLGHSSVETAKQNALTSLLRDEARKLNSPELSMLVMQIAGDHFKGVKIMIQNLIQKLLDENNREISKTHFCEKEIQTANTVRKHALAKADRSQADLTSMEAERETLVDVTMPATVLELAQDRQYLKDITDEREATRRKTLKTIKKQKVSIQVLESAKQSYKQASGIQGLQEAHSTDITAGGAGNRVGKDGTAVLKTFSLLTEKMNQDVVNSQTDDKADQANFVKESTVLKENLGVKVTDQALEGQQKQELIDNINTKLGDHKLQMGLVNDSLHSVDNMKIICMDLGGLNFGARKAKRDEEVKSLNTAMKLLEANSN